MSDAPLTAEQIAQIAARVEAATKGPWGTYDDGTGLIDIAADLQDTGHGYRCRRYVGQLEADQIDNDPTHTDWDEDQDRAQVAADATFVAHAREDVPALLAELAHVRAKAGQALQLLMAGLGMEAAAILNEIGVEPTDDPDDNRRRLYLDGRGDAWIDSGVDEHGTRYVAQVQGEISTDEPLDSIRQRTGGLREIGRAAW